VTLPQVSRNTNANLYLSLIDLIKYDLDFHFSPISTNHDSSGFAAEAPASALQTLSTQDAKYNPNIEEDKVVNANGDYAAGF
jgi:hypothetical protein